MMLKTVWQWDTWRVGVDCKCPYLLAPLITSTGSPECTLTTDKENHTLFWQEASFCGRVLDYTVATVSFCFYIIDPKYHKFQVVYHGTWTRIRLLRAIKSNAKIQHRAWWDSRCVHNNETSAFCERPIGPMTQPWSSKNSYGVFGTVPYNSSKSLATAVW